MSAAQNSQPIRISPDTLSAEFPGHAYATDSREFSIAGARYRHTYWSPDAWARTPEKNRNGDTIEQKDGAAILIERID